MACKLCPEVIRTRNFLEKLMRLVASVSYQLARHLQRQLPTSDIIN